MQKKEKQSKSLGEKIKNQIEVIKILFSVLSIFLFTAYIVYMLYRDWGQSVYLYIIMGFIGLYIIISLITIIVIKLSGRQIGRSLKNYKSGLKILKYSLILLNFMLTVSILSISAVNFKEATLQQWVVIFSALWAAYQIIYQISRIARRYRVKKDINKKRKNKT